jgi:hypothetical protein
LPVRRGDRQEDVPENRKTDHTDAADDVPIARIECLPARRFEAEPVPDRGYRAEPRITPRSCGPGARSGPRSFRGVDALRLRLDFSWASR